MASAPRIPKAEITGIYGYLVKRFSRKLLGDVPEPAERCANGTLHALENPWDSMPTAVLPLVVMFAKPTTVVSSTMAAAPSCASSRENSSSVTRGGVSVIASA